jgi:hypothetical protein
MNLEEATLVFALNALGDALFALEVMVMIVIVMALFASWVRYSREGCVIRIMGCVIRLWVRYSLYGALFALWVRYSREGCVIRLWVRYSHYRCVIRRFVVHICI